MLHYITKTRSKKRYKNRRHYLYSGRNQYPKLFLLTNQGINRVIYLNSLVNVCVGKTQKEISKTTKKLDAVRRCVKGYACKFIAKEKFKHLVSKEAFNIDGLGKKVVDQFWNLKLIKEPSDIFKLDYEKIKKLEGWGVCRNKFENSYK